MKFSTENKIRFGYGAAFFLLLIAFSYSVYTTSQLLYHIRWVGQTNRILHNLEGLLLEVKDLDASFQDKVPPDTSGNEAFYKQHFIAIDSLCTLLQSDTHKEYIASVRLQEILQYVSRIREEVTSDNGKARKNNHGYNADVQDMMSKIESKIIDMHSSEKALLNLRSQRLNSSSGSMEGINIVILLIALLLAGYSWANYYNENAAKKRANARTSEYSHELEKKITELMDANTELIQLRGLQKFTSTGRIARMIAHEVRNPLTNINLSYDQLKDITEGNEHTGMLLDTIMRNSNRINQLVSELLNATKVQELKFRKVSINQILNETLEIARDRIQLEHIRVKKEYDPDICDVEVDVDKIKIAFLNIILNAVEAMHTGQGILILRTGARHHKCIVQISDNGVGIDKDSLDKIFEPYYTGKSKGNGLGLTNTQNIILNHKGTINVESKLNEGSTFTISLDLAGHNDVNV
jgi:signal transduction histidine kinase